MTNKQTGTSGLVEVTQADRDAAAPIFRLYGAENYAVLCVKGCSHVDGLALVQAFARHRLASLSPVPVDEVYKVLRDYRVTNMTDDDGYPFPLVDLVSTEPDISTGEEQLGELAYAIAAALTASRPSDDGWMPIETAPKDGTTVLVWADGCGMESVRGYGVKDERGKLAWLTGDGFNATWPTHWRPLPDPPAALSSLVGEK